LETPPPNKNCALKGIAALLDIPSELLTIIDGKAYIYYFPFPISSEKDKSKCTLQRINNTWKSYIDQIQFYIPPITFGVSTSQIKSAQSLIKGIRNFNFDNSDEAQKYRQEIVRNLWTEEEDFTLFINQIEEIIGVRMRTPPPNNISAIKRVADIFDIPKKCKL
jgi:hypothetical protein